MSPDLLQYIIPGSIGAVAWGFLFKELKAIRKDLDNMRIKMAEEHGLELGQDHERRIARLEKAYARGMTGL